MVTIDWYFFFTSSDLFLISFILSFNAISSGSSAYFEGAAVAAGVAAGDVPGTPGVPPGEGDGDGIGNAGDGAGGEVAGEEADAEDDAVGVGDDLGMASAGFCSSWGLDTEPASTRLAALVSALGGNI